MSPSIFFFSSQRFEYEDLAALTVLYSGAIDESAAWHKLLAWFERWKENG